MIDEDGRLKEDEVGGLPDLARGSAMGELQPWNPRTGENRPSPSPGSEYIEERGG